ncbi:DUF6541 family protein [Geodermatophilus sabuli]|uniref:Uncharacterized protein n=1 Tax=Geodermatophilus sabuli TaxID=1564158 RepID=A0A285EA35_9ACTN|nr:DUF6541 family protein [Geodermatophilus sabuli]MBB3084762.1 hypothetical protein [Geodermatophilus sabuli]SNX95830.1 hypothetical protein SAMN06893097_102534 [Geodermatophilus sabuli]
MLDLNVFLTLAVAVLLLVLPGLLLSLSLRMRGWAALAASPLLTFGLVLIGILVVGLLGLDWTPWSAGAVAAVVVAGVAAGTAWRARRRPAEVGAPGDRPDDGGRLWAVLAGVGTLVGAAIGFRTVVVGTGGLASPNQGFDALFHVNLVETITRTGQVGPTVAGELNGYPEGASVYPDALHAMASLVDQFDGTSLTSINALMACIPLVAGLGLVGLLRELGLFRAAAVAPITLAATTGYPFDLIWRGPIWVFVFGITFVPAFLVLLLRTLERRDVALTATFGVSTAALALIHPSAALSAAVFGACLVVGRWVQRTSPVGRDLLVLLPAAVLAAVLALPLIGKALVDTSGGTVVDWPAVQSAGEALGELLLYNYDSEYPQLWLAVPALVGIAVGWRTRGLRWWYAATGIVLVLCILAAAYEGPLVQLLTGPWWNDRFRFEGLVFLGLAVFAAIGVVQIGGLVGALLHTVSARLGDRVAVLRTSAVAVGVVVVVVLMGVLSGFYVQENRERMETAYVPGGGGAVSTVDVTAFRVLGDLAGRGPVLNDPNDGSAWMWSLGGVQPVFGAALTKPVKPPLPDDRQVVVDGLNCLDSSERVREAVEDLGVRYVYSSEATILGGLTPNEGFRDLASVASLRPVYEQDGATIYEIDPVPLQESPDGSCGLS